MERKMRIRMRSAEVTGGNTRNWLISADDWRFQNHRCVIIRWLLFFFFFFFKAGGAKRRQTTRGTCGRCPRRGIQEADRSEETRKDKGGRETCYFFLWTSSIPFDQKKKKFSRNELTALLLPTLWYKKWLTRWLPPRGNFVAVLSLVSRFSRVAIVFPF